MIEPPKEKYRLAKHTAILAVAMSVVALLGGGASYIASRCQCHYTAALYAERDGLRRIELPARVPDSAARRDLISRLEKLDVFVDPLFSSGESDVAAVFATPKVAESAVSIAKRFANEQRQ